MEYTVDEIRQFTAEEDVKFLRLAFCDIFGTYNWVFFCSLNS